MEFAGLPGAADHHLQDVIHLFARLSPGGAWGRRDGTLFTASAARFTGSFHSAAVRVAPTSRPEAVLDAAREFGAQRRRDLVVWAADHADADLARAAGAAGLRERSQLLGMVTDVPPERPRTPPSVELLRVTDGDGADQFADVHRALFAAADPPVPPVPPDSPDPPVPWSAAVGAVVDHFACAEVLTAAPVVAFVAREAGRPVSCAMAVGTGRVAGIYWVATAADARRRGLGDLLTRTAVLAAFDRGAEVVVLQATGAGAPVYRRIGFTAFTGYHLYHLPVAPGGRRPRRA